LKAQYLREQGFLTDLLFVYAVHYNPREESFKETLSENNIDEEMAFYESIDTYFDIDDDVFLPLFYRKGNGANFISSEIIQSNEFFDDYSLDTLCSDLTDVEEIPSNLFRFLFNTEYITSTEGSVSSAVAEAVINSDFQNMMKTQLITFFSNPQKILGGFVEDIRRVAVLLENYYSDHSFELEKAKQVDWGRLKADLAKIPGREIVIRTQKVNYSICLVRRDFIFAKVRPHVDFLLLGCAYEKFLPALLVQRREFSLQEFCRALGDNRRISIYELLFDEEEMATSKIAERLDMSVAALFYHLDIMVKANIISFRSEGRSVLYSLNCGHIEKSGINIANQIKNRRKLKNEEVG